MMTLILLYMQKTYLEYYYLNQGLNEWRNIQDIVRSTFKALCEVVRSQGIAIRELEKQITTKASKSELNSGLSLKANVADVMRTFSEVASSIENRPTVDEVHHFMEDKVNRSDMQVRINNLVSIKFQTQFRRGSSFS